MSNRKVIELVLQLKSAKAHGKNCIKVKPHLVCHLSRNRLFKYAPRCLFDCGAYYNIFGKSEVLIRVPALNRSLTVLSVHHHSFSGSSVFQRCHSLFSRSKPCPRNFQIVRKKNQSRLQFATCEVFCLLRLRRTNLGEHCDKEQNTKNCSFHWSLDEQKHKNVTALVGIYHFSLTCIHAKSNNPSMWQDPSIDI